MRKTVQLTLAIVFCSSFSLFGQWTTVDSGTTNNLNGAYLLDSGIGFVVGDAGTILKSTDAGATWALLASGTTNMLHDVYLLDRWRPGIDFTYDRWRRDVAKSSQPCIGRA